MLGSSAAGTVGSVISAKEASKQQDAMVTANNQQLTDFLLRNDKRSDEAAAVFDQRKADIQPDQQQANQGAAEAKRSATADAAMASVPAAAPSLKGSAASVIGDVFKNATDREMGRVQEKNQAKAKVDSFGDLLFGNSVANADAGRKIGTVGELASFDAGMLPLYQDLAMAEAQSKNKPGMFGQLLSGLGTAGGYYAGNKAGSV